MKTLILALLIAVLGINVSAAQTAPDLCTDALKQHLQIVNDSEIYLEELGKNTFDLSSYQITVMQKMMTKRYKSLKNFKQFFEAEANNCSPRVLAKAVAIYDYAAAGKSIFTNTDLRRVFMGFNKHKPYGLVEYIDDYIFYTADSTVENTLNEIESTGVVLPDGVSIKKSGNEIDPNLHAFSDVAINSTTTVVAGAARVWGFISDQLKWRQGRIKNNEEAIKILKSNLKPLDLVFETRKFTLSNLTIPGHWGHVGVWLGTKEELIKLGVWDLPFFAIFRKNVEEGKNIVEIRKQGLNFQGIETFINLDEIAVTRVKNIEESALTVFEELFTQIDKKYDFKFDARTADKITCAEMIAFSYGDIKWPVTKTLFQYSLRPDDLAVTTLGKTADSDFILYFKGRKKKQGAGFDNMSFNDWAKLYKVKEHLSPEEVIRDKEEKARKENERLERENFRNLYGGA